MKLTLIIITLMLSGLPVAAQEPDMKIPTASAEWVYAEIMANHIPTYKGDRVLIDFGQQTEKWKYNYLRDSTGEVILFNSAVEALNYMTARGWEFVQAYTSGEDNSYTHYLLRMREESAPVTLLQQQLPESNDRSGQASSE